MTLSVDISRLLAYSDHERRKWREWVEARPERLSIPFQAGERFPTVGALLDHVFLVERRHLSRLAGVTPPESTGVAAGDWQALFAYADLVRADFRQYLVELDEPAASETLSFTVASGTFTSSKRGLVVHMLLHETRHLAQIALAARFAGDEAPGRHDILFLAESA